MTERAKPISVSIDLVEPIRTNVTPPEATWPPERRDLGLELDQLRTQVLEHEQRIAELMSKQDKQDELMRNIEWLVSMIWQRLKGG